MTRGLPDAYEGRNNPLLRTSENITQGHRLYSDNCAICHGNQGWGNGPGGRSLAPAPANLASLIRMPIAQDDYLFWAISEGGVQFGSAMPAFKESLSESDRWLIILFLRQL
ncbi:MAG: cytochrome c [Sedimenticola sp.]